MPGDRQPIVEAGGIRDIAAGGAEDDVADLEPGAFARRAGVDLAHQRTARRCDARANPRCPRSPPGRKRRSTAGRPSRSRQRACATTTCTMFDGMAKPMPIEPPVREKIAVLMPTTAPSMSTSAPPELPGLMAASVWMKKPESVMPRLVRASAETMPLVTVWPTANGLPTASTRSPTSSSSESPKVRAGNTSSPFSIFSTARSVRSSRSRMAAWNSRPSASATFTSLAPWMTWLLVTTMPCCIDDHAGAERGPLPFARRPEGIAERAAAEESLEEGIALEGRANLRRATWRRR